MEESLDNGQVCLAWTTNDLILDEIFKHLTLTDLKHARLTCRKFAIVGSRALLRNSVIRLSEFSPFIHGLDSIRYPNPNPMYLSHWRSNLLTSYGNVEIEDDLWETEGELGPQLYFRISSYRHYLERIAVFSTDFRPKNVILYNFNDLVRLPIQHFASVEELTVVFFKPSEGYFFLEEFHKLLPNLRRLELRYLQREDAPFCHRLLSTLSGIEEPTGNKCLRLEQLSLALPADFAHSDWSFLAKFKKLKSVEICWAGVYHDRLYFDEFAVQPIEMHESYLNNDVFGQWLVETRQHLHFSSLNEVSLRFDLSPENIDNIQKALAETNLKTLSLQVHGEGSEVVKLLDGLGSTTMAALTMLQATYSYYYADSWVHSILECLTYKGFFTESKRTWVLLFRLTSNPGWFRLVMEERRFTVQFDNMFDYCCKSLMTTLWRGHTNLFDKFNYGFCRTTDSLELDDDDGEVGFTKNECEAINTEAFVGETFLDIFQKQANQGHVWATRREPSMLLCNNDYFNRESCLSLWNHPPLDGLHHFLSSWSFSHVPASVISKCVQAVNTSSPINHTGGM